MKTPLHAVVAALLFLNASAPAQDNERLSLDSAISMALQHNSQLITTQREVDATTARVLQAGRIPNPELEFRWGEAPSFGDLGDAGEFDISFTQQIEFPTKRGSRIGIAEQEMRIAELRLDRLRIVVTASIKKSYYGILLARELRQGLEDQATMVRDVLDLAENKLSTGTGSYLDLIRTRVELTRLGNDIVESAREEGERKRSINILLGREPDSPLLLSDTLGRRAGTVNADSLSTALIARSSLLEAARASVEREESRVGLARKSYLPDFSVSISSERRSGSPPFDANAFQGTTEYGVGLSVGLSVPLWFWQEPAGQVREADALYSIAEVELVSTQRRIRSSINGALEMLSTAENQVDVFDRSLLADLEDIVATAINQYRNDAIGLMNLLDVYRTRRNARIEYSRALYNYWSSRADLEASAELPLSTVIE